MKSKNFIAGTVVQYEFEENKDYNDVGIVVAWRSDDDFDIYWLGLGKAYAGPGLEHIWQSTEEGLEVLCKVNQ